MCRYLSFLMNLESGDMAFWDLDSHSGTMDALPEFVGGLSKCRDLCEAHYFPNGKLHLPMPAIGMHTVAEMHSQAILEKWPTFAEFRDKCAIPAILDNRRRVYGSDTDAPGESTLKCAVLDRSILRYAHLTADDPRLGLWYRFDPGSTRNVSAVPSIDDHWCCGAHLAAMTANLPTGFRDWHLVDSYGFSVVERWLSSGLRLPDDFTDFDIPIMPGTLAWSDQVPATAIHVAAFKNQLPLTFKDWGYGDTATVAHSFVRGSGGEWLSELRMLPDWVWAMKDSQGITVASAAYENHRGVLMYAACASRSEMPASFHDAMQTGERK